MDQEVSLKGIQFLVDASGKRTAVVIDLDEWGELWEDIYDVMTAATRDGEETISWDILKDQPGSEDVSD